MNRIVNKFLLGGGKFIPEMHLKQPGFTDSACGSFTKIKKIFRNLCRQEIQNDLDKACFQHDMAHGKYKVFNNIAQSDKLSKDKAFKLLAF